MGEPRRGGDWSNPTNPFGPMCSRSRLQFCPLIVLGRGGSVPHCSRYLVIHRGTMVAYVRWATIGRLPIHGKMVWDSWWASEAATREMVAL